MRSLSLEAVDRQTRRSYSDDRLPGGEHDRNALGAAGRGRIDRQERERRRQEGLCVKCGRPIVGRRPNAVTCIAHRIYGGQPGRAELVAMLAEHEAVLAEIRDALAAIDEAPEVSE